MAKNANRVIQSPGGPTTIFAEAEAANGGERNVVTPERHVNYKMRSNFELGDEQPAPPPVSATAAAASGGSNEDLSSNCSVASMSPTSSINSSKESSPAPSTFSTPIKNRIPPGGYSTPLW